MKSIFTSTIRFAFLFFLVLLIDLVVKLNCPIVPYRFISKPLVILLLVCYYYVNRTFKNNKPHFWMFLGLTSFLIGDLLILHNLNIVFLGLSLFFFSIGKVFFCFKFSHNEDFNIARLIPFSVIMFAYAVFLISVVLNDLKGFLVPALISFFLSLLLFQFAYLRKGVFNKKSYIYVFLGVMTFIFSESMMAIKTFKQSLPFEDILIMLFYGTSMFFIVVGAVKEQHCKVNLFLPVLNPIN